MDTEDTTHEGASTQHTEVEHAGGHHEAELSTLILPLINFAVFFAILVYIFKKKVQPALVMRADSFKQTAARVKQAEDRYQSDLESIRYQLDSVDEEERTVLATFKQEGTRSAEAITRQGLEEISQLQSETSQTKLNLISQLESDVRGVITDRAIKLAHEKLATALTPEMDKNLRGKVLETFRD